MRRVYVAVLLFESVFLLNGFQTATAATYKASLLAPPGFNVSIARGTSGANAAGVGRGPGTGSLDHALLWSGTNNVVDLHPVGFFSSTAFGTSGATQVGVGFLNTPSGLVGRALKWNGTAESAVNLHPTGFKGSEALGVSGTYQVGRGNTNEDVAHALLWSGSASSVVDLHPTGYDFSFALGATQSSQVGYAAKGPAHAILWHGTAESAVNLHPAGFESSYGHAASGEFQGGFGSKFNGQGYSERALLWHGTAESVIDLNPTGFYNCRLEGLSQTLQVGYGDGVATDGATHALVWNGSADTAIDLHSSLSSLGINFDSSYAVGVADNGDIVGYAFYQNYYAVKWSPVAVPEPGCCAFLCGLFGSTVLHRRHTR